VARPTIENTPAEVEAILRSLPARFRPERAEGWGGVVHFAIPGAAKPSWTVVVADGKCRVAEGHEGEPDCVITLDEETFLAIETGQANPIAAFVAGKVKITSVGHMRRYDRAFYKLHDLSDA
jgi:putative sterol carrier protein